MALRSEGTSEGRPLSQRSVTSLALVLSLVVLPELRAARAVTEGTSRGGTTTQAVDMGGRRAEKRYLPPKPFENQQLPPCDPAWREVEINGGCWIHLAGPAPCGPKLFEHKGGCYLPVIKEEPLPSSVTPWDGGTPLEGDRRDGGTPLGGDK